MRRTYKALLWRVCVPGLVAALPSVALLRWVLPHVVELPLALVASSAAFGVCCVAYIASRNYKGEHRLSARALGLRHVFGRPPAWMAAMAGLAALAIASPWLATAGPALAGIFEWAPSLARAFVDWGTGGLMAILGVFLSVAAHHDWTEPRLAPPGAPRSIHGPALAAPWGQPDLFRWLESDDPVGARANDRFGHARTADRMARRLRAPAPPSQALVGGLGAGKSSIRELVKESLSDDPTIHVVEVELWRYETTTAAVEGIIKTLVGELDRETSVPHLRELAARYAQAMTAAGGLFGALSKLPWVPATSADSLQEIDEAAKSIGHRFVVWIEDLERFAHMENPAHQPESVAEAERLNPIRSVLHALDGLSQVCVVTATTSLQTRFDVDKIARYVEELPQLEPRKVRQVLAVFRSALVARYPTDVVPEQPDEPLAYAFDEALWPSYSPPKDDPLAIRDALIVLAQTPRALKHALRRVNEEWDRLHGEVALDDLLVVWFLRNAAPNVFATIHSHIDYLRGRGRPEVSARGEARAKASDDAFERAFVASAPAGDLYRASESAINYLFPRQGIHRVRAQGFSVDQVYWDRALGSVDIEEADRDQPILAFLRDERASADQYLVRLDGPQEAAMLRLARHAKPEVAWRVVSAYVTSRLEHGRPEPVRAEPPTGWDFLARVEIAESMRADIVFQAVALAKSALKLVREVLTWYGPRSRQFKWSEAASLVLRERLGAHWLGLFGGRPAELAEALRDTPPSTLKV